MINSNGNVSELVVGRHFRVFESRMMNSRVNVSELVVLRHYSCRETLVVVSLWK